MSCMLKALQADSPITNIILVIWNTSAFYRPTVNGTVELLIDLKIFTDQNKMNLSNIITLKVVVTLLKILVQYDMMNRAMEKITK